MYGSSQCLLLLLLGLAAVTGQASAEERHIPCTVADRTMVRYYDLRPLRRSGHNDWVVKGTDPETNKTLLFHLNICDELHSSDTDQQKPWKSAAYHSTGDKQGFSIGRVSKWPTMRDTHLLLEYNEGDECGASVGRRKTIISFICDKTVEGLGEPQLVSAIDKCVYVFDWHTPHACPSETEPKQDEKDESEEESDSNSSSDSNSGTSNVGSASGTAGAAAASAGTSFLSIIMTLGSSYMFIGILYKRFVLNSRGMDQLPHADALREAADWAKDMALIAWYKVRPPGPSRRYASLNDDHGLPFNDHDDEDDDEDDYSSRGGFGLRSGSGRASSTGGGLSISDRSGRDSIGRYNKFAEEVDAADDAIRVLLHDEQDAQEVTEEVIENVMESVVVEEIEVPADTSDPYGYYSNTRGSGGVNTTSETVQNEQGETVTTQVITTTETVLVEDSDEAEEDGQSPRSNNSARLIDDS